jgi:hypothetical protein
MEVNESVQPMTKARLANSWTYEIRYDPSFCFFFFFDSKHNIRIAIQQNKSKPQKKGAKYIPK